jgi:hypothetical protein
MNCMLWRRFLLGMFASFALAAAALSLPVAPAATPAQAQVSTEFQEALAPYGHWQRDARWGEVWLPDDVPPEWQPYLYGHWVYTDEWGWYWISDPEEEEWGWIVYHYGRWAHDSRLGWFWIPDDEWAPAWVDWRYGSGYVGWAPLPPDELIVVYDAAPEYWIFVPSRFLTARRPHPYLLRSSRRAYVFHRSRVINRTLRYHHGRAAVNPGISPAFVARRLGRALPTYRVSPHVLTGTQGVQGAVRISPQQARAQRGQRPRALAVQPTHTTIKPAPASRTPQPLGQSERGRLGSHPPRAAQGAPAVQPLQQMQQRQQPQIQAPPQQPQRAPQTHAPQMHAPRQPQTAPPRVQQPAQPTPPRMQAPSPHRVTPPAQPARPQPPVVRPAPHPQVTRPPSRPPQSRQAPQQRAPQGARPQPQRQSALPRQHGQPPQRGDGKKQEAPKK